MYKELCSLRFKNGELDDLRTRLLADLNHEQFAILLGKTEDAGGIKIVTVREVIYPSKCDIEESSIVSLRINRTFVAETLHQINERLDVDTYIEVHTHPFSTDNTALSGIDDIDERRFSDYIAKEWPGIEYASVVLSQNMYDARLWRCGRKCYIEAAIKTQLTCEAI
ncbi:MAG: hypothetical protein LBU32_20625 [Clostridiales bacterium]|jgi:hypothetical protein|nr:hypothetical protein [Clostridiales bacterium]